MADIGVMRAFLAVVRAAAARCRLELPGVPPVLFAIRLVSFVLAGRALAVADAARVDHRDPAPHLEWSGVECTPQRYECTYTNKYSNVFASVYISYSI